MQKRELTLAKLIPAALRATRDTCRLVCKRVQRNPSSAFEKVFVGDRRKACLRIDLIAEDNFEELLKMYDNGICDDLRFQGEESLRNPELDLSGIEGTAVLVDAVDGTDLLERGLGNWCTTAVFFKPQNPLGHRILLAVAAFPTGEIFYAFDDDKEGGAFLTKSSHKKRDRVAGPSKVETLEEASICFYGQKAMNFATAVLNSQNVCSDGPGGPLAEQRLTVLHNSNFRVYNIAGIPMLCRLVHHCTKEAKNLDAVIELEGQKAHDFVPGGFIAFHGGACVQDLAGNMLNPERMEQLLMRPASEESEQKYIVASSLALAQDLRTRLGL